MIKIAITDDHTLFRKGLASIINGWKDVELYMEASSGPELLWKLSQSPVDIVLLDLQMPDMNGFETCKILKKRYPDLKILILTFSINASEILKAIRLGADGYFTKDSSPLELLKAIKNIRKGGFHFEKSLSEIMEGIFLNKNGYPAIRLEIEISLRELEIIKLYALEYKVRQIAEILNISPRTVETHKKNLMKKTGAKNFIGVILFAFENKFLKFQDLKIS